MRTLGHQVRRLGIRARDRWRRRSAGSGGRRTARCRAWRGRCAGGCRGFAQLAQVDHLGRSDVAVPALERCARAADLRGGVRIEHAKHRRRSRQLRSPQQRETLEQRGRVLEQDVVAEMVLLGGHDHARRPGKRAVEAVDPVPAADRNTGPHEVVAVEWQHDVHFRPGVLRRLDEEKVGTAGSRYVHDRLVQARQPIAYRRVDRGHERRREPRLGTVVRVDHVAGEHQHVRHRKHAQDFAGLGNHVLEQQQLPPHRRDVAGIAGTQREGGGIALHGAVGLAQQQCRLAHRRVIPAVEWAHPRREPRRDLLRQRPRLRRIAGEHRQRRRIDSRVRIPRQCIGRQVLVARARGQGADAQVRLVGARALQRTSERVLRQPPAQAQDVGEQRRRLRERGGSGRAGARTRPPGLVQPRLRFVQQRACPLACAGTGVRKRAPVEELRIAGMGRDLLAERITGIPRRAALEVAADLVDARAQDPCASVIRARKRLTLISRRIAGGNRSMSAAACVSSAAFPGEPASADA